MVNMREKDPEAYKRMLAEQNRRSAGGDRVGETPHQEKPAKLKRASNDRAFRTGWAVVKEWQGPREKVEEGKRMVEGDKVRYGQRKWDNFVAAELLGYLDEEGNERSVSDAYEKYKDHYPDIDIAYRHDQDMSGERSPPYTWGGMPEKPEPATTRQRLAQREKKAHQENLKREREEDWKRRIREKED